VKRLKILTLNHEFPPVGGGAAPVALELCKHLVRKGHHVDVVTMRYKGLPKFEIIQGVNIYRTPAIRRKPNICYTHELATYVPGAIGKVLQLVRRNNYDVVHCHFIVPGGPLAWLVNKLTGLAFLITCHGTDVPGHNPARFGLVHKMISPAWRFLAKHSPLLVCPSEFLKGLILQSCPGANVRVVPNGIYYEQFAPAKKTKSILMCSRIFGFKGFQYAIQAIKDLRPDWQVNVIGDGPYLPELKKLAGGSQTPIRFWGWLDKSEPVFKELFRKSEIFIFPSEAENFPTVLLEAMAAGMTIITTTAGGCPELIGDAGLLVQPRDTAAIRQKLQEFIASEELRKQLAEKALARVKQFGWQCVAQKYLDCYREVIGLNERIPK